MDSVKLDDSVIAKFGLFSGTRSQEDDQKIYDKVMEMLFEETLDFLANNLNEEEMKSMMDESEKAADDNAKFEVMKNYLLKIENCGSRLAAVFDDCLSRLNIEDLVKD